MNNGNLVSVGMLMTQYITQKNLMDSELCHYVVGIELTVFIALRFSKNFIQSVNSFDCLKHLDRV